MSDLIKSAKLTDREIGRFAPPSPEKAKTHGFLSWPYPFAREITDAATAKCLWACYDWLLSMDWYQEMAGWYRYPSSPSSEGYEDEHQGNIAKLLGQYLQQAGIERPKEGK